MANNRFSSMLVVGFLVAVLIAPLGIVEARTPTYTLLVGVSEQGGNIFLVHPSGREFIIEALPKSAQLAILGPWVAGRNPYAELRMDELVRRVEVALGVDVTRYVRFGDGRIAEAVDRLGGITIGGKRQNGREVLASLYPVTSGMHGRTLNQLAVLRQIAAEALRVQNWSRIPAVLRAMFGNLETDYTLSGAMGLLATLPTRVSVVQLNNPAVLHNERYLPQALPLPRVVSGRTFAPVRLIADMAEVELVMWDERTRRVTLVKGGQTVDLIIGQSSIWVNGVERRLEAAPYLFGGRTMIPLRVILEHFGLKVEWVERDFVVRVWR